MNFRKIACVTLASLLATPSQATVMSYDSVAPLGSIYQSGYNEFGNWYNTNIASSLPAIHQAITVQNLQLTTDNGRTSYTYEDGSKQISHSAFFNGISLFQASPSASLLCKYAGLASPDCFDKKLEGTIGVFSGLYKNSDDSISSRSNNIFFYFSDEREVSNIIDGRTVTTSYTYGMRFWLNGVPPTTEGDLVAPSVEQLSDSLKNINGSTFFEYLRVNTSDCSNEQNCISTLVNFELSTPGNHLWSTEEVTTPGTIGLGLIGFSAILFRRRRRQH